MRHRDSLMGTSRIVVRAGVLLNRLFLAAVCLGLLTSWFLGPRFAGFLIPSPAGGDATTQLAGLRLEMLIGVIMALAISRVFTAGATMRDELEGTI